MFDQPPLTFKEAFGRGCIHGLAGLFATLIIALASMLPSRSTLYLGRSKHLWTDFLFIWPVLGTIGCLALLFEKDEELRGAYRAGALATYVLFLALAAAEWTM